MGFLKETTLYGGLFRSLEMWLSGQEWDAPEFFDTITSAKVMLGTTMGLNATNKALYKNGTLTVREVLRTQPAVILKND